MNFNFSALSFEDIYQPTAAKTHLITSLHYWSQREKVTHSVQAASILLLPSTTIHLVRNVNQQGFSEKAEAERCVYRGDH